VAVDLCKDLDRQSGRIVERVLNTPLLMRDNSALVEKVLGRKKKK